MFILDLNSKYLYLEGIKNILPNIQGCVCVPKRKNDKILINTDNALYINGLLFNGMSMYGFVFRTANFALPVIEVLQVIPTDD